MPSGGQSHGGKEISPPTIVRTGGARFSRLHSSGQVKYVLVSVLSCVLISVKEKSTVKAKRAEEGKGRTKEPCGWKGFFFKGLERKLGMRAYVAVHILSLVC
jgi:hypothetical protein